MPKKLDSQAIAKNLNRLVGYTVMGVKADDVSFRIDFMGPKGDEVSVTQANAFGLTVKESKAAIVLNRLFTVKHQDDCKDLDVNPDKVVGAVLRHVNVYSKGKGIFANRISLSFQLGIVNTKQTPGIMVSSDLSSDYVLS
jgi:hypothetical protein